MQTMIFAHRGIPDKFPENSLEGFDYCVNNFADAIEFDVHLTKDQVPVIMHDEKINRTTNSKGFIKDYTLEQLQSFKLANGETIPTLADFLTLIGSHDIHLNLEFKTNKIHYPGIEKIVMDKINHADLKYPVMYSSFNINSLKIAQQIDPTQNYNYLFQRHLRKPERFLLEHHFQSVHPGYYIKGLEHHERIWTVDDAAKQKKYILNEVEGLFTNNFFQAQLLRDELQIK